MNIFSCGWARAGAFELWLCAACVWLYVCAPHIHNINFTLKTLFYRHSQRFSWFSLAHATTIWFLENPSFASPPQAVIVCVHDGGVYGDADFIYVCLSLEHNAKRRGFVGGRDVGFSSSSSSSSSSSASPLAEHEVDALLSSLTAPSWIGANTLCSSFFCCFETNDNGKSFHLYFLAVVVCRARRTFLRTYRFFYCCCS